MRDKLSEIVAKNRATGDNFSQLSPKIMRQMSIICRQNSRDNWRNLLLNIASIVARLMATICRRNSRDNEKKSVKKSVSKIFQKFHSTCRHPAHLSRICLRIFRASVCHHHQVSRFHQVSPKFRFPPSLSALPNK